MEIIWGIVSLALLSTAVVGQSVCNQGAFPATYSMFEGWKDMDSVCVEKVQDQIQIELTAAVTYLAMGAHFARDFVNRPGFSKLFIDSASEERQHAIKLIEYLLMRGESIPKNKITTLTPLNNTWASGEAALEDALKLETKVTNDIRSIIEVCEGGEGQAQHKNHYHLVDYLAGDFLDEQYRGQREIAGRLSTLRKMAKDHGPLSEFLFDRKLEKGELE